MEIKKLFFLVVLINLLMVSFSIAAYDSTKAGDFLAGEHDDGNFNNEIIDSSIAGVALSSLGYSTDIDKVVAYLRSEEDEDGCWPDGNCKIKDTAFAILFLEKAGEDVSEEKEWLLNAQTAGSVGTGTWWLQVATSESGICDVEYEVNGRTGNKTFEIDEGRFTGCGNKPWLNINDCIYSGLLGKGVVKLTVDCTDLTSTPVISTIYQSGNDYYLFDDEFSSKAEIYVRNTCYGTKEGSSCDYLTTLYTNWVLKSLGEEDLNLFYLYSGYVKTNPLPSSILAIVTGDNAYFDDLEDKQKSDGSFESSVATTSFGLMALASLQDESFQKSATWLNARQKTDGSFGTVYETGLAAYALYVSESGTLGCVDGTSRTCSVKGVCKGTSLKQTCSDGSWSDCDYDGVEGYESYEYTCNDNLDNDCDGYSDDLDSDCEVSDYTEPDTEEKDACSNGEIDYGEEGVDCGGECDKQCISYCSVNGECEVDYYEDYNNCPEDCSCGDGICDPLEEYENGCSKDCGNEEPADNTPIEEPVVEKEGGFPWWIIIFIILLAGGIFYYYKRFYKKKPETTKVKKESFFKKLFKKKPKENKPVYQPRVEQRRPAAQTPQKSQPFYSRPSMLDKELEKSLDEARKLIGGRR
ncbi:MAG: hypothetical protein PHE43_03185 [Candidatus Nanoarchaeia archaeon]|nr:hypothetical protein [Candidatus Nanoarchaeia archaeon]